MRRVALGISLFGVFVTLLLLTALVTRAMAGEITVKVSDQDQQSIAAIPGAVDQCVAGLQLRGEANICKAIAQFATEFGAKVKAAAPAPEAAK